MKLLRAVELSKRFDGQHVVRGISFDLEAGEILAIIGPSGSGKTTTLRLIAGFERPDHGEVWFEARMLSGPGRHVPPESRGIGFVFQDYALFPHLTVLGNVTFGLKGLSARERRRRAEEVLDLVGLTLFAQRYPHELSGGQQQRVALARALAPKPKLILLDEPFSSLDAGLRESTREEVRSILKQTGTGAIMVTHDQEEALSFADRIAVIREGRLEQVGRPEEVYHHPATPFVARFLGNTNLVRGLAHGRFADTPLGTLPLDKEAWGHVLLSLRPEHLELLPPDRHGLKGQIVKRSFKGHDLTFKVRTEHGTYRVQTGYRAPWQVGESVVIRVREVAVVLGEKLDESGSAEIPVEAGPPTHREG